MGWHLIQNKENYMKKKDLILAGAVLLLAGILALALRLPKTENGNTMKVTVDGEVYGTYSLAENQTVKIQTGHGTNVLVIENGRGRTGVYGRSGLPGRLLQKTGYDFPGK